MDANNLHAFTVYLYANKCVDMNSRCYKTIPQVKIFDSVCPSSTTTPNPTPGY